MIPFLSVGLSIDDYDDDDDNLIPKKNQFDQLQNSKATSSLKHIKATVNKHIKSLHKIQIELSDPLAILETPNNVRFIDILIMMLHC